MKYVDEFRDKEVAEEVLSEIWKTVLDIKQNSHIKLPIHLMEICGGQTHSILQYGINSALPPEVEFIHGPGCPVCVTPIETINLALELAKREITVNCVAPGLIATDMLNELPLDEIKKLIAEII